MNIFTKLKSKKPVQAPQPHKDTNETQVVGAKKISVNPRVHPRISASLIKQVWITERAVDLSHLRQYTFVVDKKANKPEVKKAIEAIYNTKVDSVNIINTKSKPRRLGRSMGRTSQLKKAIVKLKEGYSIDVMPT